MKKITLLFLIFFCSLSFGQNKILKQEAAKVGANPQNVNSTGISNPVFYSQKVQTNKSAIIGIPSSSEAQNVKAIGPNRPIFYSQKSLVDAKPSSTESKSVNGIGKNSPVFLNRANSAQMVNLPLGPEAEKEILADRLAKANQTIPFAFEPIATSNRTILSDIIPTAGATETFTPNVGDHFFDPGGPGGSSTGGTAGNYPNCGCDTVTTLDGATEVDFQFFSVFATFDYLRIYDSADTSGTILYDNATGGANQGDITLADMIASNGSSIFTGTSGSLTFFFHASAVVDYGGWDAEIITASGGGGGGGCATIGPSNGFENGKSFTMNLGRIVAHDVTVNADEDFNLEMINLNAFIGASGSGVNASAVDVYVYSDAGGTPGAVVTSELGLVPTSQSVIGSNFGFDIWDVELDITDVPLAGQAGVTTTYWIGVSLEPTDGSNTFWENSTAGLIGFGEAYDDGLGGGYVIDATLEGAYTFDGTCTPIGGGGGGPCATTGPGNGFENGKSFTMNLGRVVAHDVTVNADEDFTLEMVNLNAFIGASGSGVNAALVDVYVYNDAGGAPGAVVTSELGLVPASQSVVGSNFGFDVWDVEIDITDVPLAGQAGTTTTYWIGVSLEPTDGSNTFWENSTAGLIGFGEAYDDGLGGGYVIDGTLEGVYTFGGTCTPIGGGGGGPCATTGPGNGFENGKSFTMNLGRIVAHDVTVNADEDFTLEMINLNAFIGAAGSGVNAATVDVYVYNDAGGAPGAVVTSELGLVPSSQAVVGSNFGFDVWDVELDITDVPLAGQAGTATTYWIGVSLEPTDGSNTFWENSTAGLIGFGEAYDDGLGGGYVIDGTLEGVYTFAGTCTPIGGGGNYDDCTGAIALACGDSVVGETLTATDSGGNAAPDVFYKFTGTGSPQVVTISLCGGGTDYDSLLRVFTDCTLSTEIATNDDFCGLQSQVAFFSDGSSTYYIMVEGFSSSAGNFSLDVTCATPPANDECSGAIAVSCGDSVAGTTNNATVDTGVAPDCGTTVTAPGVWYSLNDNSGLAGTITLSLCNGTAYDTKISVYTGDCGAPPLTCVDGNDDSCGLQSEITFASDGNTTFLILVHGFGGATGDFVLDVSCTPTPPPNDMIANSIDVDEIGFPYTDPAVAMPAATTENGNPNGCNLTGANGVWYNFVPEGDGDATATIVTPGGASSVTFYTAPDENSIETDLTLVPQNTNQCAPGTSASITTVAGQAYYVFVLNTGAVTDIVIDGTNLGIGDNTIEGFSFYPNPSSDILNLRSVDNIETVAIYNMLGQRVINSRVNADVTQLDVSALSTGNYIMKVVVNGETGTYRILKD